jgi:hypothetical protein
MATFPDKWLRAYKEAALEVDGHRMPQLVTFARQAIAGRLQDLEGSSDHYAERRQIEAALAALTRIESDATKWASTTESRVRSASLISPAPRRAESGRTMEYSSARYPSKPSEDGARRREWCFLASAVLYCSAVPTKN